MMVVDIVENVSGQKRREIQLKKVHVNPSVRYLISENIVYFVEKSAKILSQKIQADGDLIVQFKCHFRLQNSNDIDDKDLKEFAGRIKTETERTDRTPYKIQFDWNTIFEGYSDTLMNQLNENTLTTISGGWLV